MRSAITIVILLLATLPALAQTQPPAYPREMQTISVTGTGRVTLAPDRVSFTVGVETNAADVTEAVEQSNRKTADVIAALKRAGVGEKEIRTSNFSIFPQQDYQEGRRPRIVGYQVVNNITVTRDKTADVGRLLEAAINAGANQVHGIGFSVADPARGRDQGLQAAFNDARAKAALLAKAAGRTLGEAIAIVEGSAPQPPMPFYGRAVAMEAKVSGPVPVEQGTDELSYTISAVFELR
ncbi:MAG: SIMPL domain-containing protein [Thermoanaerobaculia bacterium]